MTLAWDDRDQLPNDDDLVSEGYFEALAIVVAKMPTLPEGDDQPEPDDVLV